MHGFYWEKHLQEKTGEHWRQLGAQTAAGSEPAGRGCVLGAAGGGISWEVLGPLRRFTLLSRTGLQMVHV